MLSKHYFSHEVVCQPLDPFLVAAVFSSGTRFLAAFCQSQLILSCLSARPCFRPSIYLSAR